MRYECESGDISMAVTADSMISCALTPFREERFLKIRELLHSSDVRFTNGEILFHSYRRLAHLSDGRIHSETQVDIGVIRADSG